MPITMSTASIPVFLRSLEALSAILDKASAWCAARKVDPAVLAATRLIPDMLPLSKQVQICCDFAKNGAARLAGVEPPKFDDRETTLDELKERIARTAAFLRDVDPAALDAAPGREIRFPLGPNTMKMEAAAYLQHFVLPNFHFHLVTAYAILRQSGIEIGKRDFMGDVPGFEPA